MLKKIRNIICLVIALGLVNSPVWSTGHILVKTPDLPLIIAHGGYGPGDGTGNDGEGPGDGTGYGPGDCETDKIKSHMMFISSRGNAGSGNNGGYGPGDGTGNGGDGPADGTGYGPGKD
ncbi:MAG: hypothetical protein WC836_24025 [Desulfobacula sp.]